MTKLPCVPYASFDYMNLIDSESERHLGENLHQVADGILNDYLTKITATISKKIA